MNEPVTIGFLIILSIGAILAGMIGWCAVGWYIARCFHKRKRNKQKTIKDGFGNEWELKCPQCNRDSMQVMSPGKVQCKYCG